VTNNTKTQKSLKNASVIIKYRALTHEAEADSQSEWSYDVMGCAHGQ